MKDRIAKRMVEKNGKRRGDQTWRYVDRGFQWQHVGLKSAVGEVEHGANIISQCRGIAIVLMAAIKGYKCIITLSEKMSLEKEQILKALGAKVVGTLAGVPIDSPESIISVN